MSSGERHIDGFGGAGEWFPGNSYAERKRSAVTDKFLVYSAYNHGLRQLDINDQRKQAGAAWHLSVGGYRNEWQSHPHSNTDADGQCAVRFFTDGHAGVADDNRGQQHHLHGER